MMWTMGLDVGTTVVKAAVFNENGELESIASEKSAIFTPVNGAAEQDANQVFRLLLGAMKQAAQGIGHKIGALSLSVQGDAIVPVDSASTPVGPVILGMDYRSAAQADAFAQEIGSNAIFSLTGMSPHPMNSLCKIRYVTECYPDIASKTSRYMTYADYILYHLGSDEPVIDYTMATRTMGMDLKTRTWSSPLLDKAGISARMLSTPVASGQVVGKLRKTLAEQTGVNPDALLVSGGHDQVCAAIGAGLGEEGLVLDSHGTAEVISTVLASPLLNDRMLASSFPCYAYADPEKYFTFSLNHTGGLLLKWFVDEFCGKEILEEKNGGDSAFELLLRRMPKEPTDLLFLPYLNGRGTPRCDLSAKGAVLGLTLNTNRYAVAKSILEALAYDARCNIDAMKHAGIPVQRIRCVGGGARSQTGLQLKADIYQYPIETLQVRESACLGAALLAGYAAGSYSSLQEAQANVKIRETYEPDSATVPSYNERYQKFTELYARVCDFFR